MKIFELYSEMIVVSVVQLEGLPGLNGDCHANTSKTPFTDSAYNPTNSRAKHVWLISHLQTHGY